MSGTTAYTDGACIGNPGPGGWAWAIPGGGYASGFEAQTTNQRMEVHAALAAVQSNSGPLHIVSDSQYVVKCFNDSWYLGWEKRGWKNASKQPVANQDLWKPFIELYRSRSDEITFGWVKGHSGDEMNDVVDRLATEAARTQAARAGGAPPTELGGSDDPGTYRSTGASGSAGTGAGPGTPAASSAGSDRQGMTGWVVAVFGHRPPQLGGYDLDNPVARAAKGTLVDVLKGWAAVHPDLVVATGLGLGAEQLAADAALQAGVPYVAVLAYPDPDSVWPSASKERFRRLLAGARQTVTMASKAPASKQEAGKAAGARDSWVAGVADAAVVIWDGRDRSLRDLVAALERRDADVFIIPPA